MNSVAQFTGFNARHAFLAHDKYEVVGTADLAFDLANSLVNPPSDAVPHDRGLTDFAAYDNGDSVFAHTRIVDILHGEQWPAQYLPTPKNQAETFSAMKPMGLLDHAAICPPGITGWFSVSAARGPWPDGEQSRLYQMRYSCAS